jgi:hypothetical protein
MHLIRKFGEMWARNLENINLVPGSKDGGRGVYVLYDGSMPVYVGKGNMRSQIRKARLSKRRKHFWDHFSWYVLQNRDLIHDTEVLFLRTLPPYLRFLTRQKGKFKHAVKTQQLEENQKAEPISRRVPKQK